MLGKKLYNKTVSIVPLVTTYISFRCLISWTVWKASSCSFPGAKLSLIAFWNTSWRMVPISIWRVAGSELYQRNTKIIQISYFTTYQQMWSYIYYLTYWTTKVHKVPIEPPIEPPKYTKYNQSITLVRQMPKYETIYFSGEWNYRWLSLSSI